jgi:hypothetical protein
MQLLKFSIMKKQDLENFVGVFCMTKKFFFTLSFLFWHQYASSQNILRGRVVNEETKNPLPSASVYLNNTSIGTSTNDQGVFNLRGIPSGKFRLIASCIGYATFDELVDAHEISGDFVIELKPKADDLQGIAITSYDPNGWEKWGKIFTDIFIGTTPNSNSCSLQNPKALKFRLSPDNILSVSASEPLHVLNSSLGYDLSYRLEEFEYNLNDNLVNYNGYKFFKDLVPSNPKKALKYEEERRKIYAGSLLHFMRAFFADRLDAEGYEIRNLDMISNPLKDRARKMLGLYNASPNIYDADSVDYFKKMLRQPDSVISRQLISGNMTRSMIDSTTASFYFEDSLEILYKLKPVSYKYKSLYNIHKDELHPVSQFVFLHKRPVYVLNTGYYYQPYDLKMTGYWAWWENMSTRLPYDYWPDRK